ncbi:MAG: hypothetical protein KTM48_04090 [Wolbachia endosymbiont of Pissodes strobi]|nr:hypothetical protein [Wolbachia endosymbiont of Pissodes strobi]
MTDERCTYHPYIFYNMSGRQHRKLYSFSLSLSLSLSIYLSIYLSLSRFSLHCFNFSSIHLDIYF